MGGTGSKQYDDSEVKIKVEGIGNIDNFHLARKKVFVFTAEDLNNMKGDALELVDHLRLEKIVGIISVTIDGPENATYVYDYSKISDLVYLIKKDYIHVRDKTEDTKLLLNGTFRTPGLERAVNEILNAVDKQKKSIEIKYTLTQDWRDSKLELGDRIRRVLPDGWKLERADRDGLSYYGPEDTVHDAKDKIDNVVQNAVSSGNINLRSVKIKPHVPQGVHYD